MPPWLKEIFASKHSQFLTGFLSIFLPCGWLWTFLSAAATTGSATKGALLMLVFWLGGLPAFSAIELYFKKSFEKASPRVRQLGMQIVSFSALYSLIAHFI